MRGDCQRLLLRSADNPPSSLQKIHFQILPVNIKSLAGSVATLANWLTSWVITMTANLLLNWSKGGIFSLSVRICVCTLCLKWIIKFPSLLTGTFTIYTLVAAFSIVFVTLWVPETKGRTLEEIQWSFRWNFVLGQASQWSFRWI